MSLLDQAKAAHEQKQAEKAAATLAFCNTKLQQYLKDIFGLEVVVTGNRYVEDGLTLMVHDDGDLHVLYKCEKCETEHRSFHTVKTIADLHLAANEEPRVHPPCHGTMAL